MSLPPLFDRLRLPVIGAPLFIVSNPDLVIAQCKAGIVGSFPALNARPQSLLDEWLHRITEELAAWDKAHPDRPSAPFARGIQAERGGSAVRPPSSSCAGAARSSERSTRDPSAASSPAQPPAFSNRCGLA